MLQETMELQQPVEQVEQPNSNTSKKSERNDIKIACFFVNLTVANIFFAFLSIAGKVGMKVTLPLWVDSTILTSSGRHSNHGNQTNGSSHLSNQINSSMGVNGMYKPQVDAYFVLSFGSIAIVVTFGTALLFIRLFQPHQLGDTERKFPHLQFFLAGFFNALSGVFVVFASSGRRTAPTLQAILSNAMIPLIIALRYLILRKVPTLRQLICAMIVLLSLFICLIPKIFTSIDAKADSSGGASGVAGILWPLCFMFGSVPAAAFLVIIERNLQIEDQEVTTHKGRINVVFYLFWMHVYQLLTVLCFFWADFVPGFGYTDSIYHFWENWGFGIKCFFGGEGCDSKCGVRGTTFVLMYAISYFGTANLTRFSEGATFVAIVNAAVTPLSFLFWTIFRESPFGFHPAIHITTWFSIGGLVPMVPAIFLYTILAQKKASSQRINNIADTGLTNESFQNPE